MAQSTAKAVSADELAFRQRKLSYRLKKSRVSYVMMAPLFYIIFPLYGTAGGYIDSIQFYIF